LWYWSYSGVDDWVTIGARANGSVIFDREPHGPLTARDWKPWPSMNSQFGSGLQTLCGASASTAGSTSEAGDV
jgi:hypothetical protein